MSFNPGPMSFNPGSSSLPKTETKSKPKLPLPFPDSDDEFSNDKINEFATSKIKTNNNKCNDLDDSNSLKRKRSNGSPEKPSPDETASSTDLPSSSSSSLLGVNYYSAFNPPNKLKLPNIFSSKTNVSKKTTTDIDDQFFCSFHSSSYQRPSHTKITPQFPVLACNGRTQAPGRYCDLETIQNNTRCSTACKNFCLNAIDIQATKRIIHEKTYLTCPLENSEKIELIVDTDSMTGQHCVVASIAPDQPQVSSLATNNNILWKTFRDHSILVKEGDDTKLSLDALDHVLEQYDQMKKHNIPVMEIYNYEQAKSGCGYFFVEKVPTPLDITWPKGTKINQLTEDQKKVLGEVRQLIESTYNARIHADIRPSNLRRRDDGTLVFIDLREDKPDSDEYEEEVKLDFANMLKTFNCNTNDEIYRYLSTNLDFKTPWPKS